jgi:hypothetical protein
MSIRYRDIGVITDGPDWMGDLPAQSDIPPGCQISRCAACLQRERESLAQGESASLVGYFADRLWIYSHSAYGTCPSLSLHIACIASQHNNTPAILHSGGVNTTST